MNADGLVVQLQIQLPEAITQLSVGTLLPSASTWLVCVECGSCDVERSIRSNSHGRSRGRAVLRLTLAGFRPDLCAFVAGTVSAKRISAFLLQPELDDSARGGLKCVLRSSFTQIALFLSSYALLHVSQASWFFVWFSRSVKLAL